ncbi:M48 family metallopeptidase [Desulfurobacterium sp.]
MLRVNGLNVRVVRSRRKTVSLEVNGLGEVVLKAPENVSEAFLKRFVLKHKNWVFQKLLDVEKKKKFLERRGFRNGVVFYYLGVPYVLKIVESSVPLELSGNYFLLSSDWVSDAKDVFIAWYKKVGLPYITERVRFFARNRFPYKSVKITRAEKRWGSCSGSNSLCFSYRALMLPEEILDYIVVHEIAHIKEKNHSKYFWKLVESILPDFRKRDRWLRVNGWKFVL